MNEGRIEWCLPDDAATAALAQRFARTQPGPSMVHLEGDLGAGKSTFARAFLRALGVAGAIPSPTYTLMERYPTTKGEAVHLDLYRIGEASELEFLGVDGIAPWLWLVEWPERAGAGLPPVDVQLHLQVAGAGRTAIASAKSPLADVWLAGMGRKYE